MTVWSILLGSLARQEPLDPCDKAMNVGVRENEALTNLIEREPTTVNVNPQA